MNNTDLFSLKMADTTEETFFATVNEVSDGYWPKNIDGDPLTCVGVGLNQKHRDLTGPYVLQPWRKLSDDADNHIYLLIVVNEADEMVTCIPHNIIDGALDSDAANTKLTQGQRIVKALNILASLEEVMDEE